jgi:hypothetical protein
MGWLDGNTDPSITSASSQYIREEDEEGETLHDDGWVPYGADDTHRPIWRRSEAVVGVWIMLALTAALATNVAVGGALAQGCRVFSTALTSMPASCCDFQPPPAAHTACEQ